MQKQKAALMRLYYVALYLLLHTLSSYPMDDDPQEIGVHFPKFDAVAPITTYDRESLVVAPPSWKQKLAWKTPEYRNIEDFRPLLPDTIAHYCTHNPSDYATTKFLSSFNSLLEEKVTKKKFLTDLNRICGGIAISLSPHTYYAIKQAFLQIIHGTEIDMRDPRFIHNPTKELQHKIEIIHELPIILEDLIKNTDETHNVYITSILQHFYKAKHSVTTQRKNDLTLANMYPLIAEHNDNQKAWYFKTISPQTAIQMADDYKNHAKGNPYNLQKELDNFAELIHQFPAALRMDPSDAMINYFPFLWRLTYMAQWLKTPSYKYLVTDGIPKLEEILAKTYKDRRAKWGTVAHSNLNTVTEEFIKIFGPITYCHEKLMDQLVTRDKQLHDTLTDTLNDNAAKLRATHDKKTLKKMSFDAITDQLKENLPTCPICFELFSDQFKPTFGSLHGVHTKVIPCEHTFCSTCLFKALITCCPLCRGTIESTIPPKKS